MIKQPIIAFIEWIYTLKANYRTQKQYAYVSRHFQDCKPKTGNTYQVIQPRSLQEITDLIVYKDESWNYIKNLTDYRKQMQKGNILSYDDNECCGEEKYSIRAGEIIVDTMPKDDNWLCFFLNDPALSDFMLSFDIEIFTQFTEIQVAFRHQDLGNRYRFMIRDNCEAVFECVYRGEFYHSIRNVPFSLCYGQKSRITVIAVGDHFQFYVDGKCVFSIKEKTPLVRGSNVGIILWNISDTAPIKCVISNVSLAEIAMNTDEQ